MVESRENQSVRRQCEGLANVASDPALLVARVLWENTIPVIMFGWAINGHPISVCIGMKGRYPAKPNFLDQDNGGSSGLEKHREEEIHPPHVNGYDLYQRNNHRDGEGGVTFRGGG